MTNFAKLHELVVTRKSNEFLNFKSSRSVAFCWRNLFIVRRLSYYLMTFRFILF